MRLWEWLSEHLTFSRHRPELHQAIQTSEDLLKAKQSLSQFTRDLDDGKIGEQHKVIHIRADILNQMIVRKPRPDFLDEALTNQKGDS